VSNKTVEERIDRVIDQTLSGWAPAHALLFVIAVVGSIFVWLKTESVPLLVLTIAGGIGALWFFDHFFFRPWNWKRNAQRALTSYQEGGEQFTEFARLAETTVRRMREKALVRLVGALIGALLGCWIFLVGVIFSVTLDDPGALALIFSAKLDDAGWWFLGGGILGALAAPYIDPTTSYPYPDS